MPAKTPARVEGPITVTISMMGNEVRAFRVEMEPCGTEWVGRDRIGRHFTAGPNSDIATYEGPNGLNAAFIHSAEASR